MTKPKPDWASYGRKGGKARLHTMTKAQRQTVAHKASRAALARWKSLPLRQRQQAARKAVLARWAKVKGKRAPKARRPLPQPLLPLARRTHHTA